ncbi:MAG: glutamate synthase-related protein [Deltaproteobacteria bacterium]
MARRGLEVLAEKTGHTRNEELGHRARAEAPLFWQVAGLLPRSEKPRRWLFELDLEIEKEWGSAVHIASLSTDSVVYKLQGRPDLLPRVYPELLAPEAQSLIALGHSRYSTNTLPTVHRSQPFSILGHNGEINTIERLRDTGRALGIPPVSGGSDSQDLNRLVEGLICLYDLELTEALELVFPAIHSEAARYRPELARLYQVYRWFFPSSAQGPAAVVARSGDICMGGVDALGLRPLWFGESDTDYFLSSEKGVVELKRLGGDPRPLAPGEKLAIFARSGEPARVLDYGAIQSRLLARMEKRRPGGLTLQRLSTSVDLRVGGCREASGKGQEFKTIAEPNLSSPNLLAAWGWQRYDRMIREAVARSGREVIGSLGHTGPLAALAPEALFNVADFFKENVAVVTNPEHFTTRTILGRRPGLTSESGAVGLELANPLLLETGALENLLPHAEVARLAADYGTLPLEEVIGYFADAGPESVCRLDTIFEPREGELAVRLDELCRKAAEAVHQGAVLLLLDDAESFDNGRVYIDPGLAVAVFNEHLITSGLRRQASIVVRSAAIRNLHDIMFLLGSGADALAPHLLWQLSCHFRDEGQPPVRPLANTMEVLQKGMEKVMSTMGIHELCGYGRIFAAIGLSSALASVFKVADFCSSEIAGLGFSHLEETARQRLARAAAVEETELYREPPRNPKAGKILRGLATGRLDHREAAAELARLNQERPTAIRHLFEFKTVAENLRPAPADIDISLGRHALPLVIAAMSFGSQGENSFRVYAEAAQKANIVCMNGEGGEIPDMMGRYRHNRGQQIASGRFGVAMDMLNSVDFLEIKIGQGAKPGEGGHLPAPKVTALVAQARHCKPGIALISPSNHHDIYSIEDLEQIVTELKTANPRARIGVKIPVTSGVGTIAVGIAKAGAHIINLSGFEGGTGAAREHAKRFVGLPVEIGVSEAHRALVAAGLRNEVEIWADGGMRSGADVVKLVLLGANRVGFGTAALMGIGCISCRRCHLDRCPRGISTQISTQEAAEAAGVKGFKPRLVKEEAENLARMFAGLGEEIRIHLAAMGHTCLQDLVGRTDLLLQENGEGLLDAAPLFAQATVACDVECLRPPVVRRPLNQLTMLISDLVMERFRQGRAEVRFAEEEVRSTDRAVGTYLAGAMVRELSAASPHKVLLGLEASVPGNGLCAFGVPGLEARVEGGSQDGAAKGCSGGRLAVLKARNLYGRPVDGSTGKSFAYGATGGLLMLQNLADSRACIRMSGADVVFGARITAPIRDEEGSLACRAHIKGFAFEYMTGGRAVVLCDPGPWLCAGMTGGTIYQCLYPEFGFDAAALQRRLARGAMVSFSPVDTHGLAAIRELLEAYIRELEISFQEKEARSVSLLLAQAAERFMAILPSPWRKLPPE